MQRGISKHVVSDGVSMYGNVYAFRHESAALSRHLGSAPSPDLVRVFTASLLFTY